MPIELWNVGPARYRQRTVGGLTPASRASPRSAPAATVVLVRPTIRRSFGPSGLRKGEQTS